MPIEFSGKANKIKRFDLYDKSFNRFYDIPLLDLEIYHNFIFVSFSTLRRIQNYNQTLLINNVCNKSNTVYTFAYRSPNDGCVFNIVFVMKEVAATLGARYSGFRNYNQAFATLLLLLILNKFQFFRLCRPRFI